MRNHKGLEIRLQLSTIEKLWLDQALISNTITSDMVEIIAVKCLFLLYFSTKHGIRQYIIKMSKYLWLLPNVCSSSMTSIILIKNG